VNIWYDVSDVMAWRLPHLTGIQRAVVGVLDGLAAHGVPCRLVRFDRKRQAFVAVDVRELPAVIRRHLPRLAPAEGWAPEPTTEIVGGGHLAAAPATRAAVPPVVAPPRAADRVLGTDPAARQLRDAFRGFKVAARELRRQVKRWLKTRLRSPAPEPRPGPPLGVTRPLPVRVAGTDDLFVAGDALLSLCASWGPGGHAEAAGRLRQRGVRVLRMIYDLIPTVHPEWVKPDHTAMVTTWVRRLLTESDHVFTISEFSRQEIVGYCAAAGLNQPDLSVVRLGDVVEAATGDEPPPLPRFVPQRPFFVCVSTFDVRKNHRLLYDAWRLLAARDPAGCPDLLCIGVPHLHVGDLLHEIRSDWHVNGRIHMLRGIDDHELAWYYRHCAATIYPSWYEGWGLPVAESLGQGRICLAANTTSIPEISGDLPEFFAPHDTGRLVELVERVLGDPAWREEREARIRAGFRPTTWTDTARQVLRALDAGGGVASRAA
jgi:glycosyltransferase involved in cell wall biosynthesis